MELDDDYFNIINYCKNSCNNININIQNYVIFHYKRTRGTIVDLIKENNLNLLQKYIEKNKIEFSSINDKYFNLETFCSIFSNSNQYEVLFYINCSDKKKIKAFKVNQR